MPRVCMAESSIWEVAALAIAPASPTRHDIREASSSWHQKTGRSHACFALRRSIKSAYGAWDQPMFTSRDLEGRQLPNKLDTVSTSQFPGAVREALERIATLLSTIFDGADDAIFLMDEL